MGSVVIINTKFTKTQFKTVNFQYINITGKDQRFHMNLIHFSEL